MTDRWLYQALQAGRDEAMNARRKCYLSIMEKIRGEASRSLQDEMGEWRLYEYVSKPRPTLRIMVSPDNRAAATIILRADRTLQVRQPSWLGKNTSPYVWTRPIIKRIENSIGRKLIERAIRLTGIKTLSERTPTGGLWENIQEAADSEAAEILRNRRHTALRDGNSVNADVGTAVSTVNRILRNIFCQPEIEQPARKPFRTTSAHPSLMGYNMTALNLEVFEQVQQESPHVLEFYCNHIAPNEQKARRFRGAEELTRTVRETIGIQGARWATFVRMGNPRVPQGNGTPGENVEAIQLATQVIQDINCPGAPEDIQQDVMKATHLHRFYQAASQQAEWQHGDPWMAWVHLLNQAMQHSIRMEEHGTFRRVNRVEDALRWHIRHQQPWGPASWENYEARSDRWHQEEALRHRNAEKDELQDSRWSSLMEETVMDGITVHPITTGAELLDISYEMNNCLPTYRTRCEQNADRIFTFREGSRLLAAGQLARLGDHTWTLGQLEGPLRQKPGDRVKRVFQKTRDLYNSLEQKQAGAFPQRERGGPAGTSETDD